MVERIIVGLLNTNTYIFSQWKKECFVIDPGADAPEILTLLYRLNMRPKAVLLTHGHLDHLGAAGAIISHYEKKGYQVPLGIHPDDEAYTGQNAREIHEKSFAGFGTEGTSLVNAMFGSVPKPGFFLEDGKEVMDSHLKVIHTPGHTPGSLCLYSEKHKTLFSGDTLFLAGQGRTDLPGGDPEQLKISLRDKVLVLDGDTRVFPGHGPNTMIERERRNNPLLTAKNLI